MGFWKKQIIVIPPFRSSTLLPLVDTHMIEMSHFCPGAQRQYGIVANCAVTHRTHVQQACRIRYGCSKLWSSNPHPPPWLCQIPRRCIIRWYWRLGEHGVTCPLVAWSVDVSSRSKRQSVVDVLGTLIDERSSHPIQRFPFGVGLDEILANFGTYRLHNVANVAQNGIISPHGVTLLGQVVQAHRPICCGECTHE